MALVLPKKDATQEEINAWIIDTQESYNKMETELEDKKKRETELLESNQKLFLKITSKKEEKEEKTEDKKIPFCLDKDTFEKLSDKDIKELNEIIEGDDE